MAKRAWLQQERVKKEPAGISAERVDEDAGFCFENESSDGRSALQHASRRACGVVQSRVCECGIACIESVRVLTNKYIAICEATRKNGSFSRCMKRLSLCEGNLPIAFRVISIVSTICRVGGLKSA